MGCHPAKRGQSRCISLTQSSFLERAPPRGVGGALGSKGQGELPQQPPGPWQPATPPRGLLSAQPPAGSITARASQGDEDGGRECIGGDSSRHGGACLGSE